MPNNAAILASQVLHMTKINKQLRTGQALMSLVPPGAFNALAATPLDIWEKNLSFYEISKFVDDHFIFDGDDLVSVFDGENILWEAEAVSQ